MDGNQFLGLHGMILAHGKNDAKGIGNFTDAPLNSANAKIQAGGLPAISRWLSEATPPGSDRKRNASRRDARIPVAVSIKILRIKRNFRPLQHFQ